MAKRGRPSKTHAQRVMSGNAGKRKMPDPDVAPLPTGRVVTEQDKRTEVASFGAPPAPKHLSKIAKEEWRRLAKLMVDRGLLRELDMMAFEVRCETYARWRKAKGIVERKGLTYDHGGLVKKRPEVGIISDCESRIARFDSEFGLTPAARARTTIATGDGMRQPQLPGIEQPQPSLAAPATPSSVPVPPQRPADLDDEAYLAGPRGRLN